jgi:hypothetical protein
VALALPLASGACGAAGAHRDNDFGPLAVFDDPGEGSSDALGGTGAVHIKDRCVTMTLANGHELVLVWRSEEVRWDEDREIITFTSGSEEDAEPITVRDGNTVTVGGEALAAEEGPEYVKRDLKWIAKPHDSCTGKPFIVHGFEA